jgi:tellurite resistance protein
MGIAGLGMAWIAAARPLGISARAGELMVGAAMLLWLALAACYASKWRQAPARARAEWQDPIQGSFVALVPASLLLMLPALAPGASIGAKILFPFLAAAQIAVSSALIARWISLKQDPDLVTPAWHLAVVIGLLFAAGAANSLGYKLTGWCFFGAGVVWWLLIESIVLPRLIQREPLPPALRAHIAIELAPPAMVVATYLALVDGEVDAIALGIFGYALFIALILAMLWRFLLKAPFEAGCWAYTFPFTALSVAAWRIALSNASDGAFIFAVALFVIANAIVLWIAVRSALALRRGAFIPPQ